MNTANHAALQWRLLLLLLPTFWHALGVERHSPRDLARLIHGVQQEQLAQLRTEEREQRLALGSQGCDVQPQPAHIQQGYLPPACQNARSNMAYHG